MPKRVFQRRSDGDYDIGLADWERRLLGDLVVQLRSLLTTDSPALVRLFPPPYGDDEERNQGYAVLAGSELMERRLAALDAMESSIDTEVLTEAELESWMRTINDVRLVLGTILDVTEDDPVDLDEDTAPMYAAYSHLGLTLERIIDALDS